MRLLMPPSALTLLKIGELRFPHGPQGRHGAAVRVGLADLDLGVGHARAIFLLGVGCTCPAKRRMLSTTAKRSSDDAMSFPFDASRGSQSPMIPPTVTQC